MESKNYGLSPADLELVRDKIEIQRKYLADSSFLTDSGQVKTLLDVSFSANHSARYYAQLVNKINTMTDYALFLGYRPFFLTMTLDGFYRDLMRGDNSRFVALRSEYDFLSSASVLDDQQKERYRYLKNTFKKIPNNDQYGYVYDKAVSGEPLTVKDLYNVLNYQMKLFLASNAFRLMRKDGVKPIYIRTVEPHSDGVPHFHAMFYFPDKYRSLMMRSFVSSFPAPQNAKSLLLDGGRVCPDGQLRSFQWEIDKPSAYVLKYVTKSFLDVKSGKELDYIQAWYVKHRIIRSVTSHTTLPQWCYRKLYPVERDWYYLTDLISRGYAEWSKEDDYVRLYDPGSGRSVVYERGLCTVYSHGHVVNSVGELKEDEPPVRKVSCVPKYKPLFGGLKKVMVNGEVYFVRSVKDHAGAGQTAHFIKPRVPVGALSDLDLTLYFYTEDFSDKDLNHVKYVENEMIRRGLIDDCGF